MSALGNQLKETNKLLDALHGNKHRKDKVTNRTKQNLSRVGKQKKLGHSRTLPVILTRTIVMTLLLICVMIVIGGIEYFNEEKANALINDIRTGEQKEMLAPSEKIDDEHLLNILSKTN